MCLNNTKVCCSNWHEDNLAQLIYQGDVDVGAGVQSQREMRISIMKARH